MSQPKPKVSVLIVDDEADDLFIMEHHMERLTRLDVDLKLEQTEKGALAVIQSQEIDAVFLDYHLGHQTGLDLMDSIQLTGFDGPVILMTDQGDEALAVSAMHAGAADYMPKSAANPKSLERSLSNALEKYRLRRDLLHKREELDRTIEDLRRRNEEIQSFYHTLSHELKTPLTAAREFSSIVFDGLQGTLTPEQSRSIGRVVACCDQMTVLMNDILDATRLETGKLALRCEPHSVSALLEMAASQCSTIASGQGIAIETELSDDLEEADIDEGRMLQVMRNLIGNAIKYSSSGGRVLVSAGRCDHSDQFLEVSVRDWGSGIDPDRIGCIFERLFQACEDDATIRGGLGLGLYLCRELVRLHGGEISVESSPGNGSTFTLTLPKAHIKTR